MIIYRNLRVNGGDVLELDLLVNCVLNGGALVDVVAVLAFDQRFDDEQTFSLLQRMTEV